MINLLKKILNYSGIIKKEITWRFLRTVRKKTPNFFLKVYYSVYLNFLKIDKSLKQMVFDFLKNDYHKISNLWLHLMFVHLKRIEKLGDDYKELNKHIYKNYCLRFKEKKHLEKLYEIYPEKRLTNYNNLNQEEIYIEI